MHLGEDKFVCHQFYRVREIADILLAVCFLLLGKTPSYG